MAKRHPALHWLFYISVLLILLIVTYKIYLNIFEGDFHAVHAEHIQRIERELDGNESLHFAVLGNIKNSVGIFEKRVTPKLNSSGVQFLISTGNAVSGGGEDKYRALYRTLGHLEMPYLLTFGVQEESGLGDAHFYQHFGPYLYTFAVADSRFVFLDATGKTNEQWQLYWLEKTLSQNNSKYVFVFIGKPLQPVNKEWPLDFVDGYLAPQTLRQKLTTLLEQYRVDAVFAGGLPLYAGQQAENTRYIVTGGAGGFIPEIEDGYYHYVDVQVDDNGVQIKPVKLDVGQSAFWRMVENLWFSIHSFFYVSYINFILLLSVLAAISIRLYSAIFVEKDYYPDFDLDTEQFSGKPLRIAMFSNNYLPFVGGVPLSIERLREGLVYAGHEVMIVAPRYHKQQADDRVVRVPTLLPFGKNSEFKLANIFSPGFYRRVKAFKPDVIHVHHPFWLGSAGIWLARTLKVPVVFTYHTRLEHYAHYVPLPGPLFRNLVSHILIRRFANRCDAVIVPTQSAEEYLRINGVKKPIYVQPTGVDYQRFQGVSDESVQQLKKRLGLGDEKILLSVSRLGKEKNIDFMLDAVRDRLQKSATPFRLLLVGSGHEQKRLQDRINKEGLQDLVMLTGAVPPDEIPVYCQMADLFVFASRSETQGMVILEAMAAGLPAIAVRSSGIDDIVINNHNGFKTALDINRWSEKVLELLQDEALASRLSDNAQQFAADYGIEAFGQNVEEVYVYALAGYAKQASSAGK